MGCSAEDIARIYDPAPADGSGANGKGGSGRDAERPVVIGRRPVCARCGTRARAGDGVLCWECKTGGRATPAELQQAAQDAAAFVAAVASEH